MVERGGTGSETDDAKRLQLPGESLEELALLHTFFDRLGREAGWPEKLTMDLLLCCEELLTNTISYGFAEKRSSEPRQVELSVSRRPGCVTLELSDNATAFNPLLRPDPDLSLDVEDRPIGGLGVYFVKQIMDEIQYEPTASNTGNKLILRKHL